MSDADSVAMVAVVVCFAAVTLTSAVIAGLKGQVMAVVIGVFVHPAWWIGALTLAKSNSWWAARFYDQAKLERSRKRYGIPKDPAWAPPIPRRADEEAARRTLDELDGER